MDILLHAHSGLRYLVLLVGIGALAVLLRRLATGSDRPLGRGAMAVFVALVHVQVLLGFALLVTITFYSALMGHIMMMIFAAVAATGGAIIARRSEDAHEALVVQTVGVAGTLLAIVFGILAIGRSIL